VIVETCAEAFKIADSALKAGHEVRVVPASLVRTLGVGARGIKTDERDARTLSEVSTRILLPSVHIPSDRSREWKAMCNARDELIKCRTALINSVRGWARQKLLKVQTGGAENFHKRFLSATKNSPEGLPLFIERVVDSIAELSKRIAEADKEVDELSSEEPLCKRLRTVCGVGPITSLRFVAQLDEISRFSSAHAVQSYLGLTPGENSSSDKKRRTGITKAGSAALRSTLVEAAWNLMRYRPADPIALWASEIEKRRGKKIAAIAVARKLAGILYAMWRDGTSYEPHRSAQVA
jgi:transposase